MSLFACYGLAWDKARLCAPGLGWQEGRLFDHPLVVVHSWISLFNLSKGMCTRSVFAADEVMARHTIALDRRDDQTDLNLSGHGHKGIQLVGEIPSQNSRGVLSAGKWRRLL
ncbi:MAG: hypothetical protein K0S45_1731 [Nitrospira sp.]|jgi:hypothetical protein|nr:hypothetical protein [Nitrospira sp.]